MYRKRQQLFLAFAAMIAFDAAALPLYSPWANPAPAPGINTPDASEGCPIESPDGGNLYFATGRVGGLGKLDNDRAYWNAALQRWDRVEDLAAPANSSEFDYCPTPLSGGRLMFVSSRQTTDDCYPGDVPPPPPPGGPSAGDIFFTREVRWWGWLEPIDLGCYPDGPNTAGAEFSPSLVHTDEGTFLYFSSNGYPDSVGQDIYMSQQRADGTFGPGERVAELSTDADDRMPNVRHDGLEIVFSSNRDKADPFDQDIYVATRRDTGSPWSPPRRIANPQINTPGSETRASLSRDGRRLYFGRKHDSTDLGDVYVSHRFRLRWPPRH